MEEALVHFGAHSHRQEEPRARTLLDIRTAEAGNRLAFFFQRTDLKLIIYIFYMSTFAIVVIYLFSNKINYLVEFYNFVC